MLPSSGPQHHGPTSDLTATPWSAGTDLGVLFDKQNTIGCVITCEYGIITDSLYSLLLFIIQHSALVHPLRAVFTFCHVDKRQVDSALLLSI